MRPACFAVIASLVVGCGIAHERGGSGGVDTGPFGGPDGGPFVPDAFVVPNDAFVPPIDAWSPPFMTAPHGPLPIIPDQGGARMHHPQLVVITYANDSNRATLEAQARWLVSSSWLATVGTEYGVGTGSILGIIERPEPAPPTITGPDIEALLRNGIADGSLPVPSGALQEALYVIYFPVTTSITDMLLGTSCTTHAGYHNETTTADGQPFSYAVIPNCPAFTGWLSDVEQEEEAVTHEVIEAATDARPFNDPGFAFSQNDAVWSPWLLAGAEVADLCEYRQGAASFVRESGFVACHVWSNAAARMNDVDPCMPADRAVPYGTLSVTPDAIQPVGVGSSITFDVTAWTNMRMPPLTVTPFGGMAGPQLFMPNVTLDRTSMNNGDHATLTVTAPFGTASGLYGIVYIQVQNMMGDTDLVPVGVYTP